jgi:hypothetical protein
MTTVYSCPCGESTEDTSSQCSRCVALRALDLPFQATEDDIEDARRTFVKVWHPDRFQHDESLKQVAEEKMRAINAAYCFLTLAPSNDFKPKDQPEPADKTQVEPAPPRIYPNRWQLFWRSIPRPTTLLAIAAVVAGVCLIGFLAKEIDSYITGAPVVGEKYSNLKEFVAVRLHQATGNTWGNARQSVHELIPQKSSAAVGAPPKPNGIAKSFQTNAPQHSPRKFEANAAPPEHVKLVPYITAGLSKAEVIAIQGAPTSTSEDKLTYGKTEFNFTGDRLAGWKIDLTSAPARVRLWPDAAVDPNLQSFTLGSTKDQVLAVQGTPTLFSDNTFGYGGSEVYFQNDRVIGWKADPVSVSLRATPR